jgi:hypothetical protein
MSLSFSPKTPPTHRIETHAEMPRAAAQMPDAGVFCREWERKLQSYGDAAYGLNSCRSRGPKLVSFAVRDPTYLEVAFR